MAWSSAINIRIGFGLSVIVLYRKTDLEVTASSRRRLQNKVAPNRSNAFFYGERTLMSLVQLSEGPASLERENPAIILDAEFPNTTIPPEPDKSESGCTVFSNISEKFLNNTREFLTNGRR